MPEKNKEQENIEKNFKKWDCEIQEGIFIAKMNNPKQNAIDDLVLKELDDIINIVAEDDSIKGLVLGSSNNVLFSRGAAIEPVLELSQEEVREFILYAQQVTMKLQFLPKISVAALTGPAYGGGLELAMACDYRVSINKHLIKDAYGLPETALGLIPGMGGTQNLKRLVGKELAKSMIANAERITPEEAKKIGLVDELVPAKEVLTKALEYAKEKPKRTLEQGFKQLRSFDEQAIKTELLYILSKQQFKNEKGETGPLASALASYIIEKPTKLFEGLAYERVAFCYLIQTEDAKEGITALIEKRKPHFKGR